MVEITKMSSKGQIVIPVKIREELKLEEGSRFVVDSKDATILLKKLSIPEALEEFDRLTKEGEKHAKAKGIKSEEDIVRIIHEGRAKNRAKY